MNATSDLLPAMVAVWRLKRDNSMRPFRSHGDFADRYEDIYTSVLVPDSC